MPQHFLCQNQYRHVSDFSTQMSHISLPEHYCGVFQNLHKNFIILLYLPHFEECKDQRDRYRRKEKPAYRDKIFWVDTIRIFTLCMLDGIQANYKCTTKRYVLSVFSKLKIFLFRSNTGFYLTGI